MLSQNCHPPSLTPAVCPRDPSIVTTCPCGRQAIESLPNGHRTKCTDDIPVCTSTCGKLHATCPHACLSACHTGKCDPCTVPISVSCRCGETARYIPCSERRLALEAGEGEVLCTTKCNGIRQCGRHACTRVCCPLAGQQRKIGKGKKRVVDLSALEAEDVEGWHTCDLVRKAMTRFDMRSACQDIDSF
jgi:transcriptional repressor NF-X1